ncbi:hypothetical protein ACPCJU_25930 [Streptomyces thermodiastaticus]|uniref:DUF4232 domain-containing protein n=1 Tax=Streptomyces thermoviolaceus subsp. thermoviolaceus TaxID=66860 RepID=A0ABX0YZX6_STRTL|nr:MULTISPECIES: hypothetical protein [Streptomyces]NJP17459.1 hypothetical protein [Streptomyces thermoviolaceus subsp. thermoviolaceus]RSR97375.1 hypothetical protein EF917_22180 [Streptomyces sp. WAC00469]
MGSLRNPVGPLPSSIYWRRRIVVLSVIALVALLIVWVVTSFGGGGDHKNTAGPSDGKHPTPSTITPGPSESGPAISEHPGGRDESGGSGSPSGDDDSSSGTDDGGTAAGSSPSAGGAGTGTQDGDTTGAALPAGSTLPDCTAGTVTLSVGSVHNTYAPTETPAIRLVAKNTSAHDCKIDLGPKTAVLTISKAGSTTPYWSSADCPKTSESQWYRVPGDSSITHTVRWDRKPSAPQCATPPHGSAGAGTYLVEWKVPGYDKLPTSFVLSED